MKSTKYYVQYEMGETWQTISKHPLLIDATIALGKECEYHPETTHRILRVEGEPVFIVNKIIVEEQDG